MFRWYSYKIGRCNYFVYDLTNILIWTSLLECLVALSTIVEENSLAFFKITLVE